MNTCSFCDRALANVDKLIRGPGVTICNLCVADATAACDAAPGLVCTFCSEAQARGHVGHTGRVAICEVCIELCEGILREAAAALPRASIHRQNN